MINISHDEWKCICFVCFVKISELKKTMEADGEALDHLEDSKKKLQRELEEKTQLLEDKVASNEKVQ